MPLASSGLSSSISRQAFRTAHNPPNIFTSSSRGIHTPSFVPRSAAQHLSSSSASSPFTSRIFHRTRTLLNAFVGHLTTPGTLRASSHGVIPARSMQTRVATRMPTIENNLSLPVRHTLSMRMGSTRLPRPPVVPRSIAQVGLGTARNFTTGRPIFQNIADKIYNVPVATRAFLEADLDSKTRTMEDAALALKLKRTRSGKSKKRSRAHPAAAVQFHPAATATSVATETTEDKAGEFDKYFSPAQVPSVITTLLVPLAPTPTSRVPLSSHGFFTYDRHPLVPFLELSALHIDSERHAARVRALFERLDAARVWDAGGTTSATCEAFGGARGAGILRVRFEGWSANEVRGILGEAATGWCVLEEERVEEEECRDMDGEMSDITADYSGIAELNLSSPIDPAYSFVLPTLDFSAASHVQAASSVIEPPSDGPGVGVADTPPFPDLASSISQTEMDAFSDLGYGSDGSRSSGGLDFHSWIEPPDALHSRAPSWAGLGFSSAFSQRLEEGPREEMF
jgi:hypothetical protein